MNHIDAIEGTVRSILEDLHRSFMQGSQDDSEYIRNVRAVIEGTQRFVSVHPELMTPPEVLGEVLYETARRLWIDSRCEALPLAPEPEASDYHDYFFDYVYRHGTYPL